MNIIEKDLQTKAVCWNTHTIRASRAETIPGRPNELYFLPEITGDYDLNDYDATCIIFCVGGVDQLSPVDDQDLQFVDQYAYQQPPPASAEFLQLALIIMREEQLQMPQNYNEALALYMALIYHIADH